MKISILITLILLTSCVKSKTDNVNYIQKTLGPIVLSYYQKNGTMPESFSQAHDATTIVLPNRGDINGNSLRYWKLDDHSFYFHSMGVNNKDDMGKGDDIYLLNERGKWVPNPTFVYRKRSRNINDYMKKP